jgi:hypothetical protein
VLPGDADGDAARPGSEVEDARRGQRPGAFQGGQHQRLRRRSWDQHGRCDLERQFVKLLAADQVCDRTALDPTADQVAEVRPGVVVGGFVKAGVEVNPLTPEGVGQENLSVQARRLDGFLGQELLRPLEEAADRPGLFGATGLSHAKHR